MYDRDGLLGCCSTARDPQGVRHLPTAAMAHLLNILMVAFEDSCIPSAARFRLGLATSLIIVTITSASATQQIDVPARVSFVRWAKRGLKSVAGGLLPALRGLCRRMEDDRICGAR
jgi:hypothetical protein